jgi:hypothetical protein
MSTHPLCEGRGPGALASETAVDMNDGPEALVPDLPLQL